LLNRAVEKLCRIRAESFQRYDPITKAIIFDLDSCLAAAGEVGEQLFALAFAAISGLCPV
jgi:hypothetical protein